MSADTGKSNCRKFAPNIFNKSKCQTCFRDKDAHTAEALESSKAYLSSFIVKINLVSIGYLIVSTL